MGADSTTTARTRAALPAVAGLAIGLTAVVGYFVLVVRLGSWLPSVRNQPWPIWLVVAAGLALSVLAVRRASRGRRMLACVLLGANLLVAGAFAALLYVALVVPEATAPAVGTRAPGFALRDQAGRTVRLDDFRGSPLLLVFYRGHW